MECSLPTGCKGMATVLDKIDAGLPNLLADSYSLYLKTHNLHWDVDGPQFNTLRQMFEQQHVRLAIAVDGIAERVRALGIKALDSYSEFTKLTSIAEAKGADPKNQAIRMIFPTRIRCGSTSIPGTSCSWMLWCSPVNVVRLAFVQKDCCATPASSLRSCC